MYPDLLSFLSPPLLGFTLKSISKSLRSLEHSHQVRWKCHSLDSSRNPVDGCRTKWHEMWHAYNNCAVPWDRIKNMVGSWGFHICNPICHDLHCVFVHSPQTKQQTWSTTGNCTNKKRSFHLWQSQWFPWFNDFSWLASDPFDLQTNKTNSKLADLLHFSWRQMNKGPSSLVVKPTPTHLDSLHAKCF